MNSLVLDDKWSYVRTKYPENPPQGKGGRGLKGSMCIRMHLHTYKLCVTFLYIFIHYINSSFSGVEGTEPRWWKKLCRKPRKRATASSPIRPLVLFGRDMHFNRRHQSHARKLIIIL